MSRHDSPLCMCRKCDPLHPASKSQVKRLAIQGVQATCWFQDGTCPDCGESMLATDGTRTWCCSEKCLPEKRADG
jgi:hypothetical protein